MKNISANELKKLFTIKQLYSYNCKLRSELNDAKFKLNLLTKNQESIIRKQVEERTAEYTNKLYEERFDKKAYVAEPSGTKKTIEAIKVCLE